MRAVNNWRTVMLRSWSLWMTRLGFLSLVGPWLIYEATGYDGIDPVIVAWCGVAFYVLGEILRYVDQGIGK